MAANIGAMKQTSLGLNLTNKPTRKRIFLDDMNRVVPWAALVALVAPHAPAGKRGRPPFAIESVLRIHFMQQWFTSSDPAMEEALHDVALFREFAGLDNWSTRLPDESTILRFRHLLEKHRLAEQVFAKVNEILGAKGLLLRTGTVVDATLIAAPSSTKNASGERDPEMHQSEGQQVVLRHEIAHRRRCRVRSRAHGARHRRQRGRGQRLAARKKWSLPTLATRAPTSARVRARAWSGKWRCEKHQDECDSAIATAACGLIRTSLGELNFADQRVGPYATCVSHRSECAFPLQIDIASSV